jgi:hypothetical protein
MRITFMTSSGGRFGIFPLQIVLRWRGRIVWLLDRESGT